MSGLVETKLIGNLSIIIVTWNGDELLVNCLASLNKTYGTLPEIVVVDNANSSATRKIISDFPNCIYVPSPRNLGFSGGNNLGLSLCSREYILLLNNDTAFHEDSISPLLQYLEANPLVAVAQGTLRLVRQGDVLDACGINLMLCGKLHQLHCTDAVSTTKLKATPIFAAKGAFLVFRSSILKELGNTLFHDFFFNNAEDVDFCHRVWLTGHEVHFVPTPPIDHLQSATLSRISLNNVLAQTFANMLFSFLTNFGHRGLFTIVPTFIIYNFLIFLRFTLAFKFDITKQYCGAVRIFFANAHRLWGIRRQVQKSRKISDSVLFNKTLYHPPRSYWLNLGKMFFAARFHCR